MIWSKLLLYAVCAKSNSTTSKVCKDFSGLLGKGNYSEHLPTNV